MLACAGEQQFPGVLLGHGVAHGELHAVIVQYADADTDQVVEAAAVLILTVDAGHRGNKALLLLPGIAVAQLLQKMDAGLLHIPYVVAVMGDAHLVRLIIVHTAQIVFHGFSSFYPSCFGLYHNTA